MKPVKSIVLITPFLFMLIFSFPGLSFALELDEAKVQGLVGEQVNGYLGATSKSPSSEVQALVSEINQKRKAKYLEIAEKNSTSLEAVEKLAGKTAVGKTPEGQYIKTPTGSWTKK